MNELVRMSIETIDILIIAVAYVIGRALKLYADWRFLKMKQTETVQIIVNKAIEQECERIATAYLSRLNTEIENRITAKHTTFGG